MDLNNDEGMTLTQRPIGVEKAKANLQSEKELDKLVKASRKMSKAIDKTNECLVRQNKIRTEKLAIEKRAAEDKVIFTYLTSISDPEVLEYLANEKHRIISKRAEESRGNEVGQGTQYQGSQYRASEYQGSGGVEVDLKTRMKTFTCMRVDKTIGISKIYVLICVVYLCIRLCYLISSTM